MTTPIYKRIVLKISGEILGSGSIDINRVEELTRLIKDGIELGLEMGVVIGGGNIFRGAEGVEIGFERIIGDEIGMLATLLNGMIIKERLRYSGIKCEVMSAVPVKFVESFDREKGKKLLEEKYVLILCGGTGNPYFSTDTAAALRALELGAEAIVKITKVDGIYDRDPVKYKDAIMYKKISYEEVLKKNLKVMDQTAFALCREHNIEIRIINYNPITNFKRMLQGEDIGSIITN